MRILLIVAWLFVGLGGTIFHLGPGREHLELDRVSSVIRKARRQIRDEDYKAALESFDEVLAALPVEKVQQTRAIMLEKAKTQMMASQLPDAREALASLLDEVRDDTENSNPRFEAEVQSTLANSQYYMTWLMRCEGLPEDIWKPEIEQARQHYTQLATSANELNDDALAKRSAEDLESTIRLARMDMSELQALPLPSQ